MSSPTFAVAFGGGGARGLAHVLRMNIGALDLA